MTNVPMTDHCRTLREQTTLSCSASELRTLIHPQWWVIQWVNV